MAHNDNCLRLCTFNCRSLKGCLKEVNGLCDTHDVIFLQEHWLLPQDLNILENIHEDFFGFGLSAVDTNSDILIGRPFGGTAVLYRKSLVSAIKFIDSGSWRITACILYSNLGPVLCCNVYMPTDYGTADCRDEYTDICSKLSVLYADNDVAFLLVAGDFNCGVNSRFYHMFTQFCNGNRLICSDHTRLKDTFTYCSDDGLRQSWIDHLVCSFPIDKLIYSIDVIADVICSDHKPLSVIFSNMVLIHNSNNNLQYATSDCHRLSTSYAD